MRNGYPLIELHRHLDGNVRLDTILDLANRHRLTLPASDVESLRPHVQVTDPKPDLMSFIAKFELLRYVMVDYDAVRRIAAENLEDAAREQIDYIELRFSPYFMAQPHGLDPFGVTEAVCDALSEFAPRLRIKAKLIVIMSRTYGPENCMVELEAALRYRHRGVIALDLAGDEANFPGALFAGHFRRASEAGIHIIAHAGEAAGPDSIRQAVCELKAERIGHGTSAAGDEATMNLLRERRIGIESCPTSNLQTSTVASYQCHPMIEFLRRGLLVTLNTDDPGVSGIDLAHEYRVAREKMGLSETDLRRLQENALQAAFLTDEERRSLTKFDQAQIDHA